jgi:hypothetical protein
VTFTPSGGPEGSSGHIATGQIGPDGSYTLTTFNTGDGAILGTHKATVVARDAADMEKLNRLPGGRIAYKLPPSTVGRKYSQVATTPFTFCRAGWEERDQHRASGLIPGRRGPTKGFGTAALAAPLTRA